MSTLSALTLTDLRNISRDSLLKFLIIYPFVLGLLMRWLVPLATHGLANQLDLRQYYDLIASFFGLLIIPMLAGLVIGFLLLDERDDRTLAALQVTPLSMNRYLFYRLLVPVVISILSLFIVLPLMNIVDVSYWLLLPVMLLAALEGPIFTLMLAAYATNKVQGLALMKAMGIFFIVPLVSWFVPEPWQWAAGIMPPYWPVKAFWMLRAGESYAPVLLAGLVVHLLFLVLLLRRFNRVIYAQ